MKLSFDETVEEFRAEFIAWLADNRPTAEEMEADPAMSSGHAPGWARRWTRRMFDAGWLVPGWPPERGGRDATPTQQLVYLEEMARAGVPRTTNPQGLGIVAPSILDYGSPEQIENYALPILRGEKSACLGMSEPGAGSDLAGLTTRAVRDGDTFVINGQKLWTSGAGHTEFCFLFCRTDPDAPKHKGISVILVDMNTPGLTVRPVPEIVDPRHAELNEVFLSDVIVPADNLVGTLNNGWAMANGSLAHERGMVWVQSVIELENATRRLLGEAPAMIAALPADEQATAADRIADLYIDAQAARCLGYLGFGKLLKGGSAPEQALMKMFSSETRQQLSLVAAEIQGPEALSPTVNPGVVLPLSTQDPTTWIEQYLRSFGVTISAGSSEIQRNIIADKVLGLPRS
ncbi:MAG TPA: acyl-CoA dehydrogenase family protein [Acidimicrobiales bacterium]|nr:acyl-CoA dehydrogenase family protein [Acidimicrobiales bacterium]